MTPYLNSRRHEWWKSPIPWNRNVSDTCVATEKKDLSRVRPGYLLILKKYICSIIYIFITFFNVFFEGVHLIYQKQLTERIKMRPIKKYTYAPAEVMFQS